MKLRDRGSYPYKTTGCGLVLTSSIFSAWGSRHACVIFTFFYLYLESFASHFNLCMLITEIYHATQGVACFCLNQKYLSNAKVMIFWNVMRSLADDGNVMDKKMLRT